MFTFSHNKYIYTKLHPHFFLETKIKAVFFRFGFSSNKTTLTLKERNLKICGIEVTNSA